MRHGEGERDVFEALCADAHMAVLRSWNARDHSWSRGYAMGERDALLETLRVLTGCCFETRALATAVVYISEALYAIGRQ